MHPKAYLSFDSLGRKINNQNNQALVQCSDKKSLRIKKPTDNIVSRWQTVLVTIPPDKDDRMKKSPDLSVLKKKPSEKECFG